MSLDAGSSQLPSQEEELSSALSGASCVEGERAFAENGYLYAPKECSFDDADTMLHLLWGAYFEKHAICRERTEGWFTKTGSGIRLYGTPPPALKNSSCFAVLVERLHEAADRMFGSGTWRCGYKGHTTVFVNCPNVCGSWTVPASWHTDFPQDPADPKAKVMYAFAFLDKVEPGGGGTMLLTGSSLRAQADDMRGCCQGDGLTIAETRSHLFMEALAQESVWFKDLFGYPLHGERGYRYNCNKAISAERVQRFMVEDILSGGIRMQVVELTGMPGTIVFWDPRCLHSPSNNKNSIPRSVIRFRLDRVPT